ncbi:MAG: hypothetical protein IJW20_03755 [Clostridia bacterium]|nr:hypothetical protein [Clostridia bacterium]
MINVPEKIFDRNFEEVDVGVSTLSFYKKDEIEDAQIGFRYDNNKKEIKKWKGKEYVVIGNDSALGDPIIAKVDEKDIPIYSMFHDDWSSFEKVAESFEQYIGILEMIEKTDLHRRDKIIDLLDDIEEIVPEASYYYWKDLINSAFDFFADVYEE